MANPTHAAAPAQLLDEGVATIKNGSVQAGAKMVYQAACKSVTQAAARQGITCRSETDIQDFLHRMDGIPPVSPEWNTARCLQHYQDHMTEQRFTYLANFMIARSFLEHARTPVETQQQNPDHYWTPDEYDIFVSPVRELVEALETAQLPEAAR